MVADMMADMEMDMVADMEVNKVADKVADMVADMFADIMAKKGTQFGERGMQKEEEQRVPNLVRELVTGVGNWAKTFGLFTDRPVLAIKVSTFPMKSELKSFADNQETL